MSQRGLSQRQACWQEFLAQYDFEIIYIKGEDNLVADALSCVNPDSALSQLTIVAPVLAVTADTQLLEDIKKGYDEDDWCVRLKDNIDSAPEAEMVDGDMLNPHKGLARDLKTKGNRKISNNKSLWTVNSKVVLLGDTSVCKTYQKQDSAPWLWSIRLPKRITHCARWTYMLRYDFAQRKMDEKDFGAVSKEETTRLVQCKAV